MKRIVMSLLACGCCLAAESGHGAGSDRAPSPRIRDGRMKGPLSVHLTPDPWVPSDHKSVRLDFEVDAATAGPDRLEGTYTLVKVHSADESVENLGRQAFEKYMEGVRDVDSRYSFVNAITRTTSAAVLVTLGLALGALRPTVSAAAESAAPAVAPAKTTAPTGPYHAGCLKFTTPGKQAVELFIQFRDGRALASHVLVDGKFYSPGGIGQHEMAPNVALDNVEGLRFDGTKLQGDWKWVTWSSVETLTFETTVRDGIVTGKAGQAELTGWLRSEEQMAQVNGLAPERNWPSSTGPREDWSGIDTGAKLTTDFSKSLMVWFSEAEFGGGRETRQCPVRWLSGNWSPIVGEGRIFFIHQQPAGEVVDEAAQKYAPGLLDKLLARPNVLLDPYLTPNT